MRDRFRTVGLLVAGLGLLFVAGCASNTTTPAEAQAEIDQLESEVNVVKGRFKEAHPDASEYYDGCAGYAVFPNAGRGAFIIGAGHGQGLLLKNADPDQILGRTSFTQGTIGLSIGGQRFSEIIFFEDEAALNNFKNGNLEINVTASAVIAGEGATGRARYDNGVAIFVMGETGLMVEAAIGGQMFKFTPI